jgi:regulator of nucleoside diphosphate kinase
MPQSPHSAAFPHQVGTSKGARENSPEAITNPRSLPPITVTTRDASRLAALVGDLFQVRGSDIAFLARELDRANIVAPDEISEGVVTMRSLVDFWNGETGRMCRVMLAYPAEASVSENKLSVLTPVGTALLGLTEGECMPYETADGSLRHLTVAQVLFQPEANGMTWL